MDLSYDELDKYITRICSGIMILEINSKCLLFRYPNTFILMRSKLVYDNDYKSSINEGLLSSKDMSDIIKSRNLINEFERKKLSSLKSKLEAQRILLAKTTKVKANQDRIKKNISDIKNEIDQIEYKELSKLSMSADTRAEESRLLYLCWSCCYDIDTDNLFWKTYDDFLNEFDLSFRQNVLSEFVKFYRGISTDKIRFIARSNLWRIRYVTSLKVSEPLFGVPTSEYTSDMLNLAYWSHFYQNIYEMMPDDQPSQDVIDDDESLDAYLEDYYREKKRDSYSRHNKSGHRGKLSAFNSEEVIVTRSNELYEDVDYDNPKEAQAIKDRNEVRKLTRSSKKSRVGTMPDRS